MEERDTLLRKMGVLKSDHFGIEMNIEFMHVNYTVQLKSDHFGIEIFAGSFVLLTNCLTKIRPFWD